MRGRAWIGGVLVSCAACLHGVTASAQAPAPAPAPAPPGILDVRASQPAVPVQVSGGVQAFGLTPFQLRDVPAGDYILSVRHGAFEGGSSKLRVRASGGGPRFEVGSVRAPLLLRSAIVPGLGHLQARDPWRAGSAFAQSALAGALAWDAQRDLSDATDRELQAQQAYTAERDAENLASRRSELESAEAVAHDARAARWRWIGAAGWAYSTSLLDLFWDTRPVAAIVTSPEGSSLQVQAHPTSRSLALLRGLLHPGSGHHALNHRWRGVAFEVLSSAGVYACLAQQVETETAQRAYSSAHRDYVAAGEENLAATRTAMLAAHANWSDEQRLRNVALIATGTVWMLNLVDVLWSEPVQSMPEIGVPRRLGAALHPVPGGVGAALTTRF